MRSPQFGDKKNKRIFAVSLFRYLQQNMKRNEKKNMFILEFPPKFDAKKKLYPCAPFFFSHFILILKVLAAELLRKCKKKLMLMHSKFLICRIYFIFAQFVLWSFCAHFYYVLLRSDFMHCCQFFFLRSYEQSIQYAFEKQEKDGLNKKILRLSFKPKTTKR